MKIRTIRSRHFHVHAREMLLEEPTRCPFLPGLAMVGLAVTADEQHHLILEIGDQELADRFYAGPTQHDVKRRARTLSRALQQRPELDEFHAGLVEDWVLLAWEAALDELVEAILR